MPRLSQMVALLRFLGQRKLYWLLPLVLLLLILSALWIFAEGSAAAPLIYTIF